jgi:hypothetical protein
MQIFNSECLALLETSMKLAFLKTDMQNNEHIIMTLVLSILVKILILLLVTYAFICATIQNNTK